MALLDEVRQEVHHAQVIAGVTPHQKKVIPQNRFLPSGNIQALQVRAEGVEQSLIAQSAQAALQVQQVGDATAEAGVRVGQSVD